MTDQLVKFSEGATGGFETTTKISSKTLVRISKRVFRSWTLKNLWMDTRKWRTWNGEDT